MIITVLICDLMNSINDQKYQCLLILLIASNTQKSLRKAHINERNLSCYPVMCWEKCN